MAMSLTAGYRRGLSRRHLTCGVCREVFRSPRLLPCHHSFCLDCIEGLMTRVQAPGVQDFPCPHCHKPTPVPENGALGFQLNFYIPEEDLELERNAPQIFTCPEPNHEEDPLLFFCVPCDRPICLRCKVTKHESHETQDLPEVAARCNSHLEASRDRLDVAINHLTKVSADTHGNLEAVRLKENALIQEVQARRDAIVARVDKWRDGVVGDIQQCSCSISTQLTQDAQSTQRRLDSLVQLRQRLNQALSAAATDMEKVRMEKEMRQGEGSDEELSEVREWVSPTTALRPVVHYDHSLFTEDTIHRWLGVAGPFSLPFAATVSEVLSRIYQCGQDGACREVHSICHIDEDNICISFGASYYAEEKLIAINDKGFQLVSGCVTQEKICFFKYNKIAFYSECKAPEVTMQLVSKGRGDMRIKYIETNKYCRIFNIVKSTQSVFLQEDIHVFNADCEKPVAFSVTKDGQLFAVVEEKKTHEHVGSGSGSSDTQRKVKIFQHGQSQPLSTYTPSDTHFRPTAVCFWQEDGQEKLLVADTQNDSVHVVRLEQQGGCCFERYLAAGNGNLLGPTALEVDDRGNVWIGCTNGWILKCETELSQTADALGGEGDSEESVSGTPLQVDNISLNETASQLSSE